MNFSAFTPLAGGSLDTYKYPVEYPFDLDAGLDFTRPKTGVAIYPFPLSIGSVQGCLPLFDQLQYAMMKGELQNGPWAGAYPNTPQELSFVFPDLQGGLMKVAG